MSSDQKQIITPENTSLIGKPVIIYDATGREVEMCFWCDTKTGKVRCFEKDFNGEIKINGDELVTVEKFVPIPLRIVPCKQGETR